MDTKLREMLRTLIGLDRQIVAMEEKRAYALEVDDFFGADDAELNLMYLENDKECIMNAIEQKLKGEF